MREAGVRNERGKPSPDSLHGDRPAASVVPLFSADRGRPLSRCGRRGSGGEGPSGGLFGRHRVLIAGHAARGR